jgi:DNA-binding transcriptional LysR family regulator
MALNLQALRVFAAVVDHAGFSRAAAALHLSQPAVSKAVSGLERDVGMPLLERGMRGGRGVSLTEAGALLHERARELFAVERGAEEELRALRGLDAGALRIGASTTVANYLLPPLLGAFHDRFPGVALRVTSANTRAIARLLLVRRLDVALVEGPVSHARIEVVPWREDALVVIAPPEHPLAARRSVAPDALAAAPFILRERGSGTRTVAEAALRARGLAPPVALTLGSTEAIKQAVRAGLGLSVLSRAAVEDQLAAGTLVALRVHGWDVRRALTLLRLRGRAPGPAARRFEEALGTAVPM